MIAKIRGSVAVAKIRGRKPEPEAHIRMQINDKVFDESGPEAEVSAKFKKWLDYTMREAVKPMNDFKKLLESQK